ncbi:glycosyltransferase [Alsobacter sp. R-9]
MKGYVESADFRVVSGWAYDPARPDAAVEVEVLDGDRPLLRALADELRGDLQAAGLGNGCHGFRVRLPDGLLPASRHVLRIRYAGTDVDVPGSPCVLEVQGGFRATRAADLTRDYVAREIAGARVAADLGPAIGFVLQQLDQLLEARSRLTDAGVGPEAGLSDGVSGNALRNLLQDLQTSYPPLALQRSARPDLSIILPAFNQFHEVYATVRSIAEHESRFSTEVIVVDVGSEDLLMLSSFVFPPAVRVFRTKGREGWTNAVRAGMALVSAPVVWVMDPGLTLAAGAVDGLMECLAADPGIALVSPVIADQNNRVLEAGKIISPLGEISADHGGLDVDSPAVTVTRDCAVASHLAMAFRRSLWQRLQGFDRAYDPAGHHEADFTARTRAAGFRSIVAGHVRLGARGGIGERWKARWPVENHLRHWLDRWSGEERSRLPASRPSILFIDDHVPTPDRDAGSRAIVDHMLAFQRMGYDVSFMPNITASRIDPQTRALEDCGVRCLVAPFVHEVRDAVQINDGPFDAVYLHRYTTAMRRMDSIRAVMPGARVLLNVADLHALRVAREAELAGSDEMRARARQVEADEVGMIRLADATIVHSHVERDLLKDRFAITDVHVVPWSMPLASPIEDWQRRTELAFVGSGRHRPNIDCIDYLLSEIMPRVRERLPDVGLRLIGPDIPLEYADDARRVRVDGWVPSLPGALSTARLTVAPLRFGAGVKGKVLDSWALGIPCVMSSMAAEGLPVDRLPHGTVFDGPDAFAENLVRLYQSPDVLEQLSTASQSIISSLYSRREVEQCFSRIFAHMEASRLPQSVRS